MKQILFYALAAGLILATGCSKKEPKQPEEQRTQHGSVKKSSRAGKAIQRTEETLAIAQKNAEETNQTMDE